MPRAVYSSRFIQQHGLTSSASFAVPAGFIAVVRDLDAFIGSPVGTNDLFMHGALGQAIFWDSAEIGTSKYMSWRGRQVLEPGELLAVEVSVGAFDAFDVTVSGYLLALS